MRIELPLLAALGATFGFLTGMGLWSEIHSRSVDFALWAACLGLAAYVLFDPAMDALYDWLGAKRPEFPEGRKKAATVMAALATVLVSAFHHSLDVSFDAEFSKLESKPEFTDLAKSFDFFSGWGLVVVIFLCIGMGVLLITHWWARGARHHPPRAAHYGGVAAVVAGMMVVSILLGFLAWKHLLSSRLSMVGLGVLGLLWFVGPGILGGWAINKERQQEGAASPTRGILGHLAIFSVAYVVLLLIVARALETFAPGSKDVIESYIWLPIAALISQNLGWALAPYFRREFCDPILAPSAVSAGGAETAELAGERTSAAVVEIPRRDGAVVFAGAVAAGAVAAGAGAAGAGALAATAGASTPPGHARELLLKPKGDRLWATIGLLLSLATSAAAYHLGTLRKDPDISANVQKNFQQDSGLQSSGLAVQSNDHIVTLTGYVATPAEHQAALQRALAVRGVKQVVDEIQVAPPPPPRAVVSPVVSETAPEEAPPAAAPAGGINATVSVGKTAAAKPSAGNAAKVPARNTAAGRETNPAGAAKASSAAKAARATGASNAIKSTGIAKDDSPKSSSDAAGAANSVKKLNPFRLLKKKKNGTSSE